MYRMRRVYTGTLREGGSGGGGERVQVNYEKEEAEECVQVHHETVEVDGEVSVCRYSTSKNGQAPPKKTRRKRTTTGERLFIIWMKDTLRNMYSSLPAAYVMAVKNPMGKMLVTHTRNVMCR